MTTITEKKRNTVLAVTVIRDEEGVAIGTEYKFSNGNGFNVLFKDLSTTMVAEATAHGLAAKIRDGAAIGANPDTGKPASVEEKEDACREICNNILAGAWNRKAGPGEGGATGNGGLLYRALVIHYEGKRTTEQVKAFLAAKTKVDHAALRKVPAIAAIIEGLKAKEAKTDNINAEDLLAGLDD